MKATGKVVGGHTPQYYDNKEKQAELEKSRSGTMIKPEEIEPGQIWMGDADFPYQHCYKGEFAYIMMSTEPYDNYWKVAQFQEWDMGAQIVEFTEEEIRMMKYIGHIKDLKNA